MSTDAHVVSDTIDSRVKRIVKLVHPDLVDISENIRFGEREDPEEWAEFKKSVKASGGNLTPIECDYDSISGKYISTGGRRRREACRELGLDVQVAYLDGVRSLATRLEEGLILNKARGNSWWNYVIFCQKVMKPQLSTKARREEEKVGKVPRQQDVKDRLGTKDSTWARYMQIAEALPLRWIQDLAARGAKKETALALVGIKDQQKREAAYLHYLEHGELPSGEVEPPASDRDGGGGEGGEGGEGGTPAAEKPSLGEKLTAIAGIIDTDGTKKTALHMSQALGFTTGSGENMRTREFTITGVQLCRILACRGSLHEKDSTDILAMLGINTYREDPEEQFAMRFRQAKAVLAFGGIDVPRDPEEAANEWYQAELERAKHDAEEKAKAEAAAKQKATEAAKLKEERDAKKLEEARKLLAEAEAKKSAASK